MKQAWNSSLNEQQTKAAVTLFGNAREQEAALARMRKLILMSKSPGTIGIYMSSIRRWQIYANRKGFQVSQFGFDDLNLNLIFSGISTYSKALQFVYI